MDPGKNVCIATTAVIYILRNLILSSPLSCSRYRHPEIVQRLEGRSLPGGLFAWSLARSFLNAVH